MSSLLDKLEGLQHKFEEISLLITDPAVIADMQRYIKLNKEYSELSKIMDAQKEYKTALLNIQEAKDILANENDPEMREMARTELDELEPKIPEMEENIKFLLIPADQLISCCTPLVCRQTFAKNALTTILTMICSLQH